MKKLIVAAAGLVLSASAAAAADAPGCSADWAGFYAGIHGGYVFGDTDTTGPAAVADGDVDIKGIVAGGLAGVNVQDCDWVYGMEADFGFSNADGADGVFDDIDLDPNFHLRARAGKLISNDMLLFAAVGVAAGDFDATVPGVGNESETHLGLSLGVGVDYMFTPNWVLRAEYLLDIYGDEEYDFGAAGTADIDAVTNTIRAAISYKF